MLQWPAKDPDEVLDFRIDWADALGVDTIQAVAFTLPIAAGLTITDQIHTTTDATVWLSGGTINSIAQIQCRITTDGGRTMDQTIALEIVTK